LILGVIVHFVRCINAIVLRKHYFLEVHTDTFEIKFITFETTLKYFDERGKERILGGEEGGIHHTYTYEDSIMKPT
jgi:hypothetical protein